MEMWDTAKGMLDDGIPVTEERANVTPEPISRPALVA